MVDALPHINKFTGDLENLQDEYIHMFVNPYRRSYTKAYKNFRGVLKAQGEANKAAMELALTAFSIASGGLLTVVFGKSALKSVAADVTIDVICENNLERAFKAADFVAGNETASYILGQFWDTGQSLISAELKKSLEDNATAFPALNKFKDDPDSIQKFADDPDTVHSYLEDYVLNAKIKAHKAAAEIRDSKTLSEQEKLRRVGQIGASRFCNPEPLKIKEAELARDIELTWWMTYILTLDYLKTVKSLEGVRYGSSVQQRTPIKVRPSSAKYPNPPMRPATVDEIVRSRSNLGPQPVARRRAIGTGMGRIVEKTTEEVVYNRAGGSKIRDRIDELYKAKKGKVFFKGAVSREELVKAEAMLRNLGNSTVSKLAKKATAGR